LGVAIELPVEDRDAAHAAAAAERVAAFWPGASAKVGVRVVSLESDLHAADRLELIWTCALLNERLVADGADRRSGVLADLLS
jgi:hypothetical protein